jgi:hypothetical protein
MCAARINSYSQSETLYSSADPAVVAAAATAAAAVAAAAAAAAAVDATP